jgi:hypothetical protein
LHTDRGRRHSPEDGPGPTTRTIIRVSELNVHAAQKSKARILLTSPLTRQLKIPRHHVGGMQSATEASRADLRGAAPTEVQEWVRSVTSLICKD